MGTEGYGTVPWVGYTTCSLLFAPLLDANADLMQLHLPASEEKTIHGLRSLNWLGPAAIPVPFRPRLMRVSRLYSTSASAAIRGWVAFFGGDVYWQYLPQPYLEIRAHGKARVRVVRESLLYLTFTTTKKSKTPVWFVWWSARPIVAVETRARFSD